MYCTVFVAKEGFSMNSFPFAGSFINFPQFFYTSRFFLTGLVTINNHIFVAVVYDISDPTD
jgi:hypothetical protein